MLIVLKVFCKSNKTQTSVALHEHILISISAWFGTISLLLPDLHSSTRHRTGNNLDLVRSCGRHWNYFWTQLPYSHRFRLIVVLSLPVVLSTNHRYESSKSTEVNILWIPSTVHVCPEVRHDKNLIHVSLFAPAYTFFIWGFWYK